jgi:hypothetical protein
MRGLHAVYYDTMGAIAPNDESARVAMGRTIFYSQSLPLAMMTPNTTVSSTTYALVQTGQQYLVYQPGTGSFTVSLAGGTGNFSGHWYNPTTGTSSNILAVPGGGTVTMTPPFAGPAVLWLHK